MQPQATKNWGRVGPMGCSVCGELLFAALLGPGCQHRAAAAPRHQPWAGTSASLAGAEVAPAPILGEGDCCSCPPRCCRAGAESSRGCGVRPGAAALLPRNPGKARKTWEVPAGRNLGYSWPYGARMPKERPVLPLQPRTVPPKGLGTAGPGSASPAARGKQR